jgi:hypothetical protein
VSGSARAAGCEGADPVPRTACQEGAGCGGTERTRVPLAQNSVIRGWCRRACREEVGRSAEKGSARAQVDGQSLVRELSAG